MIKLYKHQKKFVDNISKQFKKGKKHVFGQSPTGSGKTIMFSYMASEASKKGNKVLIITDRVELLSQAGGTIESFDMNPYYITAGTKYIDRQKNVYIAMSQTLRNRMKTKMWYDFIKNHIKMIIIDEAHKQEFNHLFKNDFIKDKFVLGVSATPYRSGKMTQLGVQYDTIVQGRPIKWLIKKGYLLNCDIFDCGSPDMSQVKVNRAKGDFSEFSMFKTFDNAKLYKGLLKNYLKIAKGKKMMVFCCSVDHAIKTTKTLVDAGLNAKFIASKKMPPKEPKKWTNASEAIFNEKFQLYKNYQEHFYDLSGDRKEVFKWFKSNKDSILVNVDIATTGFDDPEVEVIGFYRATMSLVLYLQIIGRGSRVNRKNPELKTHFTVLDFGGNKSRFGPYDVDRGWSLWHDEVKPGGGVPPMKTCGFSGENKLKGSGKIKNGCERLILAAYKICPFCGFVYPTVDKAKEIELQLSEIIDEKGQTLKTKPFALMSFEELTDYRRIKKHHIYWLYRMLWLRDGEKTIKEYAEKYKWKSYRLTKVLQDCKSRFN